MELRTLTIPISGQKVTVVWDRDNQSEMIIPVQLRTIQYMYNQEQDMCLFPLYSRCGHIGFWTRVTGLTLRSIRYIDGVIRHIQKEESQWQETPFGGKCRFCRNLLKRRMEEIAREPVQKFATVQESFNYWATGRMLSAPADSYHSNY